jgi:hypothetical protein
MSTNGGGTVARCEWPPIPSTLIICSEPFVIEWPLWNVNAAASLFVYESDYAFSLQHCVFAQFLFCTKGTSPLIKSHLQSLVGDAKTPSTVQTSMGYFWSPAGEDAGDK